MQRYKKSAKSKTEQVKNLRHLRNLWEKASEKNLRHLRNLRDKKTIRVKTKKPQKSFEI